jgi:hypothetical protein
VANSRAANSRLPALWHLRLVRREPLRSKASGLMVDVSYVTPCNRLRWNPVYSVFREAARVFAGCMSNVDFTEDRPRMLAFRDSHGFTATSPIRDTSL